jgi:hypothetical protein
MVERQNFELHCACLYAQAKGGVMCVLHFYKASCLSQHTKGLCRLNYYKAGRARGNTSFIQVVHAKGNITGREQSCFGFVSLWIGN